jgi:hypothetical protein
VTCPVHARRREVAPIPAPVAAALGLVLAALIPACTSGAGKRETSALIDAVEGFRRADAASRAAKVRELGAVPCSEAPVCEARRVCVEAAAPTTQALRLKDEVAARVADIEQKHLAADAPEAEALPAQLDEAAKLLEAGHRKMTECERRLADLRVQYGS